MFEYRVLDKIRLDCRVRGMKAVEPEIAIKNPKRYSFAPLKYLCSTIYQCPLSSLMFLYIKQIDKRNLLKMLTLLALLRSNETTYEMSQTLSSNIGSFGIIGSFRRGGARGKGRGRLT